MKIYLVVKYDWGGTHTFQTLCLTPLLIMTLWNAGGDGGSYEHSSQIDQWKVSM